MKIAGNGAGQVWNAQENMQRLAGELLIFLSLRCVPVPGRFPGTPTAFPPHGSTRW